MEAIARELAHVALDRVAPPRLRAGDRDRRHPHPLAVRRSAAARRSASRERFGVDAHVVPGAGRRAPRSSASSASPSPRPHLLHELVQVDMTIGVAWGSTMAAVSRRLVPKPCTARPSCSSTARATPTPRPALRERDPQPLRRGVRRRASSSSPSRLLRRPAHKARCGASAARGAILDDAVAAWTSSSSASDRPTRACRATSTPAATSRRRTLRRSSRDGVVGDVATVFFRADGSSDGIPLNERATGPDFDVLRRVPRRCASSRGVSKVTEPRGALAAGLATDLVIDEATARAARRTTPAIAALRLTPDGEPARRRHALTWNESRRTGVDYTREQ